jgi:hypothetical protein
MPGITRESVPEDALLRTFRGGAHPQALLRAAKANL